MRDEYPPFRLDTGGLDPGSTAIQPTPGGSDNTSKPVPQPTS